MRIGILLLPIPQHRLPALRTRSLQYLQGDTDLIRVQDATVPLGAVGAAGFLILIAWVIWGRARRYPHELLDVLGAFNIYTLLIATAGGFAGLIAFFFSPQIRVYNRISVYIAFFAFAAVVAALQCAQRRWFPTRSTVFYAGAAILMGAGLWDLTPSPPSAIYHDAKTEYDSSHTFVKQIEASVPRGSMIFQLPYHPFPESGFTYKMLDYEPFRGFLHSDTLRWSYGAMKGRPADEWQRRVAAKPVPEMLRALAVADFAGIYIDRLGYADNAIALSSQLAAATGVTPLESSDQRFLFFSIGKYVAGLKSAFGASWKSVELPPLAPAGQKFLLDTKAPIHTAYGKAPLGPGVVMGELDLSPPVSVEVVVRPASAQDVYATILSNHGAAFTGITIEQAGALTNTYSVAVGSGTSYVPIGQVQLAPRRRAYLALQIGPEESRLYLNGRLVASKPLKPMLATGGIPLRAGNWLASDRQFRGEIEEVAIAPGLRTAAEIKIQAEKLGVQ